MKIHKLLFAISVVILSSCGEENQVEKPIEIPILTTSTEYDKITCEQAKNIVNDYENADKSLVDIATSKVRFCKANQDRKENEFIVIKPAEDAQEYFFDTMSMDDVEGVVSLCNNLTKLTGAKLAPSPEAIFLTSTYGPFACNSLGQSLVENNLNIVLTPTQVPINTGVDMAIARVIGKDINLRGLPSSYYEKLGQELVNSVQAWENALKDIGGGQIPKEKPATTVLEAQINILKGLF